jgi:hypothetical protein
VFVYCASRIDPFIVQFDVMVNEKYGTFSTSEVYEKHDVILKQNWQDTTRLETSMTTDDEP